MVYWLENASHEDYDRSEDRHYFGPFDINNRLWFVRPPKVFIMVSDICAGLMIMLNEHTSVALQELAPLLAGIGIGMLFHAPYQLLTIALGPKGIACATSAFFLVRFTGSTCGLVSATSFQSGVHRVLICNIAFPISALPPGRRQCDIQWSTVELRKRGCSYLILGLFH